MNEQMTELDMYDPLPFEARLSIQEQEEDERFRQGPSKNELDDHDYCQRYPEAGRTYHGPLSREYLVDPAIL